MLVALLASGGSALTLHGAAPSAARGVFGGVSRCAVARMDLVRQVNTPCNGVSPAAPCCCAAHITLPPACVRRHLRSLVRQVNTAEFEEEIQDCSTPIILDVFAVWCGPCQLMAPQLELVAEKLGDKVWARIRVSVRFRLRLRLVLVLRLRLRPNPKLYEHFLPLGKVLINPQP